MAPRSKVPGLDPLAVILSAADVERLLPMRDCIGVMEQAFVTASAAEYAVAHINQ